MPSTCDLPFEVTDDDRSLAWSVWYHMNKDYAKSGDVFTSTLARELGAQIIAASRNKDLATKCGFYKEMDDLYARTKKEN